MTSDLPVDVDTLRSLIVDDLELLPADDFTHAVAGAARRRVSPMRAVAERAGVGYTQLLAHLAQTWQVQYLGLRPADVDPAVFSRLPQDLARRVGAVAFARDNGVVKVAFRDPRQATAIAEVRRALGAPVEPWLTDHAALARCWLLYRPPLRELIARAGSGRLPVALESDLGPADIVTRLFEYAAAAGASDIHIEPFEFETIVRFRIDGVLQETLLLFPQQAAPVISRIKVLAQMRVDEKRAPQDGRLRVDLDGIGVELRASALPTMWGEKLVLRVLSQDPVLLDLADLGLSELDLALVVSHVMKPFGMVLVTGPTGSGKTTSLYAFLMRVASERQSIVNISTVEDPIEYTMPRINQVPIRPEAGLDFASGLRALLRQDPDVVMVGEIRDRETADMAVRAALVGRLMLSSLHTNDAPSAVPRLLDMGIEPYLLASTLSLVVGQRLVRRLCPHCRETQPLPPALLATLAERPDWPHVLAGLRARGVVGGGGGVETLAVFVGRGCARCHGTGYRGRLALFEVLAIGDAVRRLAAARGDGSAVRATALADGFRPLIVDGLAKALLGQTTVEEVLRTAA
jgi:type IV pilus assembly protein PilB